MRIHSGAGARRHAASVLRWAEALLVIGGAAMLAWCALLLVDATVSQWIARRTLETAAVASSLPPAPATAREPMPAPSVRQGSPLADISIPRVALSAVVLHGSDDQTLRRGPGHLEHTALPGEIGNVVIAGHRDSFFRPLRHVRLGDDIFVGTPQARFHYRVTSLDVVGPRDLSVLEPTDNAVLTLITCYPFWALGSAPDRFVVRATRVTEPAPATVPVSTPPQPETISPPAVRKNPYNAIIRTTRVVPDDESLVRQALERFRVTYNARLASHNDVRPGGPLTFQSCTVTVANDRATAACETAAHSSSDGTSHVWSVILQRSDPGWAIRSVVSN